MLSFKLFIENKSEGLIPSDSDMSLEEFLETLEGSSIRNILDKASYMRMLMGNMRSYGIVGPGEGKDAAAFVDKLTNFINKDILKHRPKERVYETQEFKDEHNYAEYNKFNKERFDIFRAIVRAKDEDEKTALRKQKSVLEDEISNTEYAKAMRAAEKEYDRQVNLYHNTPLSKQDLSDDGSPQYRDMEQAYNKLIGKVSIETDEDVIDV